MPSVRTDLFTRPDLYCVTYEGEALLVHSSVPANNNETIKRILINVRSYIDSFIKLDTPAG